MKRVNTSIGTISIMALLLLTTFVFCFFGWLYYGRQKTQHLSELYGSLDRTTSQLAKGLSIAVWNFDEHQIAGVLESGLLDKNIDGITIKYNDQANTVISVFREGNEIKLEKTKYLPERNAILFSRDIKYDDEKVGELMIYGTPRLVIAKLKRELTLIALFVLLLIGVTILGVYFILYFIVIKPVQALEQFSLSVNAETLSTAGVGEHEYFREFENLSNSLQKMISSLDQSYNKLEKSEKRFKDLTNLLPLSVFEIDMDGFFRFMNDTGLEQFDLTAEELANGVRFSTRIHHDDLKMSFEFRNKLAESNKSMSVEYRIIKKDGTHFPMLFNAAPLREAGKLIGFIGAGMDVTELRANETAINELLRLDYEKEREAEKQKATALIEGQENERLRISREIHDGIGQMITAIKFSAESIDVGTIVSTEDVKKLEYTKSLIRDIISELRQISSDLSPTFLYDYGLYSATNQLVINLSRLSDVEIELKSNVQKNRFSQLVEITMYRIVQEALNNAMKYAKAKNIRINLILDAEFLELTIDDDGVGCDLQVMKQLSPQKGNGLKNITSRASLIGATVTVTSAPFRGFHIGIQVPMEATDKDF